MTALTAEVQLSDAHLQHPALWELRVILRNEGSEPVRFSTATLLGQVVFEVTDGDGEHVALGPPPVPPVDLDEDAALDPGASLTLTFYGDELFADTPPPGRYRLRFVATPAPLDEAVTSPWVAFSA